MLINIDDFSRITTVAHEKEFNALKKSLLMMNLNQLLII